MNTFRLGDRVRSTEGGDTIGTIVDAGETSSVVEVRGDNVNARVRLPNERLILVESPPEVVGVFVATSNLFDRIEEELRESCGASELSPLLAALERARRIENALREVANAGDVELPPLLAEMVRAALEEA